jgi:hypothetical protein
VCEYEQRFSDQEEAIQKYQTESERLGEELEEREAQLEEMTSTITSLCDQVPSTSSTTIFFRLLLLLLPSYPPLVPFPLLSGGVNGRRDAKSQ